MKDKFIKMIKNNRYILFTIMITIVIINVIFIKFKMTPFGNNGILDVDFFHQYCPLLFEYYNRFKDLSFSTYSFNMGLGLPVLRNFLTYLASPLNLLILLFSKKNLIFAFSLIIELKVILSAASLMIYLKHKYKKENIYFVSLSILYAFSGYFTAFYWNIMWLDILYLLPLVVLGIEKIVDSNKWKLYCITLIISLVSNYYMGYMLCLFSVIYFVFYNILKKNKNWKKSTTIFILVSFFSGLVIAFLLLPQFLSLLSTSSTTDDVLPFSRYYEFSFLEFMQKHLSGAGSSVLSTGSHSLKAPNIYVGTIMLPLLMLFITNKRIDKRKRILYVVLLISVALPFFIAPLDYIFHAFHVPNDLPYRYSFLYSFVLILIASETLNNIKNIKLLHMIIVLLISIVSLILLIMFPKISVLSNKLICTNIIILIVYFIYYLLLKYSKFKKITALLFIITISFEVYTHISSNWEIDQDIDAFNNFLFTSIEQVNSIKKSDKELFYRMAERDGLTTNDSSLVGYYGYNSFSSMNYYELSNLQFKLGSKSNEINSYEYLPQTPIFDLMFDIKYILDGKTTNLDYYSKIEDGYAKFDYSIGLGFGVYHSILDWKTSSSNPFVVQNNFINEAVGVKPLVKENNYNENVITSNKKKTVIEYEFINNEHDMYGYFNFENLKNVGVGDTLYYNATVFDDGSYNYNKMYAMETNCMISIPAGTTVRVTYKEMPEESPLFYYLDDEKFIQVYNTLKQNKLELTSFKESKIKGKINLDDSKIIYTSIPYDPGWNVYVDGEKVKTYAIGKSLLGFESPNGRHNITLKYTSVGFREGLIISLISLCIFINRKRIKGIIQQRKGDKNAN